MASPWGITFFAGGEKRKQQDSNLRGGEPPYAVARRCLSFSAMLPDGRRGSRTPKAVRPTRFRDGVPRPWQSFPVTSAGVEPATSRLRVGCSAELSYEAMTWPAGIEPAAPRVSGGRSTGLSYGHKSRRGWDRTSDLLFVRQALVPTELLAHEGSGTRNRTSTSRFRAWRPAWLDDPGMLRAGATAPGARRRLDDSPSTPRARSRRKVVSAMSRPAIAEAMFSKPLALLFNPGSSTMNLRWPWCPSSWRSFGARCVRIARKRHW